MVTKKQSEYRSVDDVVNCSRNVPPTEEALANYPVLRRTPRKNAWGKQLSSISEIPVKKFDHGSSSNPSTRKTERQEKLLPSPGKKKPQSTEEQKNPSPLRRSERSNEDNTLNRSNLKRKWMDRRSYRAIFGPQQGTSDGTVKNDLEMKHEKLEDKLSSRYVEYWVPVSISTVQLEQYCAVLLANSVALSSCSKNDLVGVLPDVLVSTHKCCDHPYSVDPSLQGLLVKGLSPLEYLDVSIKASGKLQFLDTILSEIRNKGHRVLILFQYISGSGRFTTGDILDDFLLQRFGQDCYERVNGSLPQHRKQAAVKRFNDKNNKKFVFLLDIHACQPSIKLSSVDGIIFFESDWNPSFDLKALDQMSIDSSLKKIKIFRLYSPFTLQEKVLILAAQNVTLDNSLHNLERSTSHQLLMWGASYLFKKLDLFHDANTTDFGISLEPSILKDVTREFLGLLSSQDEVHMETSLIVKVKHNEGSYSKNIQLLGERELQNAVESQLFWANLLDGRSPKWKYPSGLLRRNRKRVNYSDEPNEASKGELDVRKKRKKTRNIPTSPSSEFERNETEPIEKGNSTGLQPVSVTQSSKGEASEMLHSFHLLLKSNIAKVSEVLQLPDDVKSMAGELLDYIIDNHHISRESESIIQAFQISLCWNAASLAKKKFCKDKSLAMVKKHLNFSCTEEEANLAYWRMRKIIKIFLEHIHGLKEPKYLKDLVLPPAEKGMESHFKEKKKNHEKNIERLLLQQEKEIHDLENKMEQKIEEVNTDYRMHVAVIHIIYGKSSMRSVKRKRIEEDFDRKMEELKQQKEICLKELKEKHACEMIVERKKATGKFEKLKSFSPADFSGDSTLSGFKPVVVGEHVPSIGSESFEKTDKTWSTSDEPKLVSSGPKTCIDDQSSRQPVNGTVGFTLKPRGGSDIDTFPGVLNRESEQQPHCTSAYITGILERSPLQLAPNKELSCSSKVPSKSSSTGMEVSDPIIVAELVAEHCQVDKAEVSDSISATELIAAHCQVDKTSLVVNDEMRSHNDKISPFANSDKICCEEPGSVDRARLQQESLDFSNSLSTKMEVCDSINATELIAEHVQTDKISLVVIDEMRNQYDKISQSANSNTVFCEDPGSVDRECELIAEHGQTDETSLVVIDEMRNQYDKISQSTNSITVFCEEPGSVDRERELIAEHGQRDETSLVVIDEMRNENDKISQSANSNTVFCEEPGSVDRERKLIAEHGQADENSLVVIDEMRNQNDKISQSTNSNTLFCEEPGSVDRERELIAEHGQADETSLVVIDEMRNQNDKISQSTNSNTVFCEEHGSVDRDRLQQESTQVMVGSGSVFGSNDPNCDKLLQVELPLLLTESRPIDKTHGREPLTIEMDSIQQESLAGSTIIADLINVSGRDGRNCGEHIGNVDRCSSQQVSIAESQAGANSSNNEADLHRVSDVVERTPTRDNTIIPPASLIAGSQAGADSSYDEADLHSISDVIETSTQTDNTLLTPASVIAGTQAGADSGNKEADLHSVSNVVETTSPTNNPPDSVIAGSNEASAIPPNIDICSSIQVMTTSVQVVGSVVLSQETTQTPISHHPINMSGPSTVQSQLFMHEPLNIDLTNIAPPANAKVLLQREESPNQLIAARDLRSFPSVNAFPLRQVTQLPMVTAQPRTSNLSNHSSFHDLLQIEVDRLSKEMDQLRKNLNDKRSVIESARAKELEEINKKLEEINKKYDAEINETETAIASNIKELYIRRDKVLKNKTLAEVFCSKFDVRDNGLLSMQQLHTDQALVRQTTITNAPRSNSSLNNNVQIPITSCASTRSVMQSASVISNMLGTTTAPRRASFIFPPIKLSPSPSTQSQSALQSASIISNTRRETFTFPPIRPQAGAAIRTSAPHLRFKPSSYHVTPPCNSSVRTNVYGISDEFLNPLLRPVGSMASPSYRHGLQTVRHANPVIPSNFPGFPSPRPTTPHGFSLVRPVIHTNPTVQAEIGAPPDNKDGGTT